MKLNPEQCQIVLDNLRLAKYVANKFNINRYFDHEEVLAVSYYALVLAALGYDPEGGTKFSTYAIKSMKRMLYREFMYQYKNKPEETHINGIALWEYYCGSETPEDGIIGRLSAEQLIQRINRENPGKGKAKTRAVINLRYFYPDLTQQEIAQILGCSQKNVSLILQNVRKRYRQELAI